MLRYGSANRCGGSSPIFYAPNTFMPNSDGKNDFFFPVYANIDTNNYSLMVFDRWGNLVYETKDITHIWDGTVRNKGGAIVQEDVYAYSITYRDEKSKTRGFWKCECVKVIF